MKVIELIILVINYFLRPQVQFFTKRTKLIFLRVIRSLINNESSAGKNYNSFSIEKRYDFIQQI